MENLKNIHLTMDHLKYTIGYEGDISLSEKEKKIVDSVGTNNLDYCIFAVFSHRHPNIDIEYNEQKEYIRLGDKKMNGNLFRKNIPNNDLERLDSFEEYENIAFSVLLTEVIAGEKYYPDDLKENQREEVHQMDFLVEFLKIGLEELKRRNKNDE